MSTRDLENSYLIVCSSLELGIMILVDEYVNIKKILSVLRILCFTLLIFRYNLVQLASLNICLMKSICYFQNNRNCIIRWFYIKCAKWHYKVALLTFFRRSPTVFFTEYSKQSCHRRNMDQFGKHFYFILSIYNFTTSNLNHVGIVMQFHALMRK